MKKQNRAYLELHIAIFLLGFTAILGALIALPPLVIVWWRLLITVFTFPLIMRNFQNLKNFSKKEWIIYSCIGIVSGLQWLTFFIAIKLSTASLTVVALSCTTFFVAILEPLFFKKRIRWLEVGIGILIIPAIILVVQGIPAIQLSGLAYGIVSAFLAALYMSFNKIYVVEGKEKGITYIELIGAWVFFTCIVPFTFYNDPGSFWPDSNDFIYLSILAVVCTVIAYVLIVRSLTRISAFISALSINLELPYGIILAILLLKEHKTLDLNFYIGVLVMFCAVIIYPILVKSSIKKWKLD